MQRQMKQMHSTFKNHYGTACTYLSFLNASHCHCEGHIKSISQIRRPRLTGMKSSEVPSVSCLHNVK